MVKGKTVLLGVSGGIAAYKAAALCSKLTQAGADVHVMMTDAATQFITPLTFQTLSRNRVTSNPFDESDPAVVTHIDLADRADLFVIAPATANIIGKIAQGIADDMISTTFLATTAPVLIAPAMNVHMYAHPAVQQNMQTLRSRGVRFVEPEEGQLACGYVGKGRLAEPEQLYAVIADMLHSARPLAGKKVLVTAGGTIERIDPVRYITNDSSGKMGFAVAQTASEWGAEVTLVCGHTTVQERPSGVNMIHIESAQDMYEEVISRLENTDIVIKAAAVADYRPVHTSATKIKKIDAQLQLALERTPDILQAIGERKTNQFVVGFAAETNDVERHALDKLKRKNCDLIVANDVSAEGAGFGTDTNIVNIYDANGLVEALPLLSKREVAERLLKHVSERLQRTEGEQ